MATKKAKKPSIQLFGSVTYPGGRTLEISAPHREWVDWALRVLEEAAAKEKGVEADFSNFKEPVSILIQQAK